MQTKPFATETRAELVERLKGAGWSEWLLYRRPLAVLVRLAEREGLWPPETPVRRT